jgi:NADH:ubiquinone reductase (H+-translocating)
MAGKLPEVVIVGGGFGGLHAARALAKAPVHVTVVDRRNYHLFQPLLYQVATAGLAPGDIAAPIRSILRKQLNVDVTLGEVTSIDAGSKKVLLADGTQLAYDFLVLAAGATDNYFGHPEWESVAPPLKSVDHALDIRRRILGAYEAAERETDEAARRALLTFVVIGGGATGVEMAGAIAEIARMTLKHDFRRIDPAQSRVILLEGSDRVLPSFPPDLSQSAVRQLHALGAEVRTGALVTAISEDAVYVGDERIATYTTVWAAGVKCSPLGQWLDVPLQRGGRVPVEPDLTLANRPEIYVIGDLAWLLGKNGQPLPGVAPVAIQQGTAAGQNIARSVLGEQRQPFKYVDKGTLATIGRAAGVGVVGGWHVSGFVAWATWLAVHLYFLVGFENRFVVLVRWAWAYFTYQRGSRLITGDAPRVLAHESRDVPPPGPSGAIGA